MIACRGRVIICVSVLSIYIGTKIYLPTDILQGLGAMFFFYLGDKLKGYNIESNCMNPLLFTLGLLTIIASFITGGFDVPISMVRCHYGYFPINVMGALFCMYIIYIFSNRIKQFPSVSRR